MDHKTQYPKFIWVIGGIILVLLVSYALFSRQNISKIVFPGGEVQFESPETKDRPFSFAVYHDMTNDKNNNNIDVRTNVYIDGKLSASLFVEPSRRFASANITLPKPGTYRYRLEQETRFLFTDPDNIKRKYPSAVKVTIAGLGKINVKEGDVFIVEEREFTPASVFTEMAKGSEWKRSITLRRVE